jgi:hypothetical protein
MFTPNAPGRVAELERRLADALARLPKHSTPMAMMMEIEELEEDLARARDLDLVQNNTQGAVLAQAHDLDLVQRSTQEENDAASNGRPPQV